MTVPDSVKEIGGGAFYGSDKVTVYGVKDSVIHKYAQDNYIKFAQYVPKDDGAAALDTPVTQTKPKPIDTKFSAPNVLNKLGLFNGVGTDSDNNPIFDLDRAPTRQEALVMLIRLLGLEKTALASTAKHPFGDVAPWADRYVGYAYSTGLTNGVSADKFGSGENATLQQYSVFLLRALGYNEKNNDFSYANALDKALEIGIIASKDGGLFTRGGVAQLPYNTLLTSPKGSEKKLANKLLWDDVFTTDQLNETRAGKLMIAADMPDLVFNGVIVYNLEDLRELMLLMMRNNQDGAAITVPGFKGKELETVYDDIIKDYHRKAISSHVTSWDNYIYPSITLSNYLMMEKYYDDPARFQKNYQIYSTDLIDKFYAISGIPSLSHWVEKVDGIVAKHTKPSMSEAEKVKALHDYLIKNTAYDRAAEGLLTMSAHFATQVIFEGYGVCDGYSEAFKILMNGAGIECKAIYSRTPNGLHAWNQVKVDGVWYNIDVTWDDPDDGGNISYDYFCRSDAFFSAEHLAEEICKAEKCPNSLDIG